MSPGENSSASMCSNMFLSHLCKNAAGVGLVSKILQPVFHRGGSVEAWEIKFCSIYFKSIRVHHASAIINLEVISGSRSIILPAIERGVRRPPRPSS